MVAQLSRAFVKARPSKIWPRLVAYTLFEGRPLTTRGRWLNPVVSALHQLWARIPVRRHNIDPIFILGMGRSGTTILGSILALHPDVGYLNEPKALWQAALGDDDLIGSYSDTPGRYRMSISDASADKIGRLHRSYGAYLALSGCNRVVDKYPELVFRTGLVDAAFPVARKIILVRNGVELCQSIQNWSRAHTNSSRSHTDNWWGRDRRKWRILLDDVVSHDPIFAPMLREIREFTRHVDMAAVEWVATMQEVLRLTASDSEYLKLIHYEDLIANPRLVMTQLLRFCALSADPVLLDFADDVLARKSSHCALRLNPAIKPAFDATMGALGYRHQRAA